MPEATVLVVDDDPVIQKLLQVNFEVEGFEVVIASDGEEGLKTARRVKPDIVLLDVMMPRMDGLKVAASLKADAKTAKIPIILLSAKAQEPDLKAGRATGADRYVTKPFDPLELLATVRSLIAERQG